jgi:hypothetical protein
MTMTSQQNYPAQIQDLIDLMDTHDRDSAMVKLNELSVEVQQAVAEMECANPPRARSFDFLSPAERSLRLLSARLRAAKSEIRHTHFMQAKERLQAALHAQITGEELGESSTA